MSGMHVVMATTIGGALVFGMMLALFGRLKLALAQHVRQDASQIRRLLAALNVALVPLMLLSGVLLDLYGARAILLAGSAMLAVALVSLSLRPTYPHAFASLLLASFGASALGTASTVLMPHAFFPAEETSASLNLGYVFIALGALLTPALSDILLEKIELRRTLAVFALLSLVPAFLGVLPSSGLWQVGDPTGEPSTFFAEPACWLGALVFFFYAPLEGAISLWTFTLLKERGHEEGEAAGLLSGFWAAFMVSRLLTAVAQHTLWLSEWWERSLIVVPPLLAAVLLGNLAGASHSGRPRSGLILLGLVLGPVLPTLLALLFHAAPTAQGTAYGFVFAAGSLGSFLLAPLVTLRIRPSLQTALRIPILFALMVTVIALVLGLMMP